MRRRWWLAVVVTAGFAMGSSGCELSPWSRGTVHPGQARTGTGNRVSSSGGRSGKGSAHRFGGAKASRGAHSQAVASLAMRPKTQPRVARPAGTIAAKALLDHGFLKDGSPWVGAKNAPVIIEEFSEFGCPFCSFGARVMHALLRLYPTKIKLVFRHTPIVSLHADSMLAAEASMAAAAQGKFWPMHDILFGHRHEHSKADLIRYAGEIGLDVSAFKVALNDHRFLPKIKADMKRGAAKGVDGTPTFFVNGKKVEGAQPLNRFRTIVAAALKRHGS
ncbi:MAG: thioredoxin domain-containing protein [Deltaproteobacteria bacterium]|nr:thioredoxin domain-containing protein [Deltaproteobacteria bacterium]